MSPNNERSVNFLATPSNKKTPKTVSVITKTMERGNVYSCRKIRLNESSEKYSCSLYDVPLGSTNFTNPEKVNIIPTKIRIILMLYFFTFLNVVSNKGNKMSLARKVIKTLQMSKV